MRWNQLANDIPRATALADILCAAVAADGRVDEGELVVVDAMLMKVLGSLTLPDELGAHVRAAAKRRTHDIADAYQRLALTTEREKKGLLQVITDLAQADGKVTKAETKFLEKLGALLSGQTPPQT